MLDQARSAQGKSDPRLSATFALRCSRLIEHDITHGTAFFSPRISRMVLFFGQGSRSTEPPQTRHHKLPSPKKRASTATRKAFPNCRRAIPNSVQGPEVNRPMSENDERPLVGKPTTSAFEQDRPWPAGDYHSNTATDQNSHPGNLPSQPRIEPPPAAMHRVQCWIDVHALVQNRDSFASPSHPAPSP